MEFCPTKYERYAAALREISEGRAIKEGFSKKTVDNLKKISLFEAIKNEKNYVRAINITAALDMLLSAVFIRLTIRGINAKTFACVQGDFFVNIKILELILALICHAKQISQNVTVFAEQKGDFLAIRIAGVLPEKDIKKAAALAGGAYFRDIKSGISLVLIPIKRASCAEKYYPSQTFVIVSKGWK